ncbi:hypothetical protein OOZ51_03100 [Arthrobacter sp. MI7-26]|uniref:hypothetical protein n=1 Tax=Arthrobacter sp. MI7-26 TaxID=2993653 RepID=UPI00224953AA|nr:hypothetical protein [Arthrobacter sp. MI7-26]MCX2746801.1 hypothetical protein [Arthrobacter sp. MI7-26]
MVFHPAGAGAALNQANGASADRTVGDGFWTGELQAAMAMIPLAVITAILADSVALERAGALLVSIAVVRSAVVVTVVVAAIGVPRGWRYHTRRGGCWSRHHRGRRLYRWGNDGWRDWSLWD